MKIVTGKTGVNHVMADDDRALNLGIIGKDNYVLPVGDMFKLTMVDVNTARVSCGDLVMKGCHARIPAGDYDDLMIDSGSQGYNRKDLIVAKYKKDTGIENVTLEVIKGTPSSGTAETPEYPTGSIYWGAAEDTFPLYEININGINIGTVKPLFEILYSRLSSVYTKAETDDHIKNAVDKETQARTSAINGVKSDISLLSKKDTELSQGIDDNKNKLNAVNEDIESVKASVKNLSDKHTNDINNVNESINTVVADVLKLQNVDNKYSAEFTNIAGVMSLPLLPDETKVSTIADVRKLLDPLVASLHDGFINLAKIKIESGGSIINPGGGMIGS